MAHGLAIYMDVQFSLWKCSKKERERNERKEGKKRNESKKMKGEEEKIKERRKKGKKEGNRNQRHEVEPDSKGPRTALREVGFLLLRLFYA